MFILTDCGEKEKTDFEKEAQIMRDFHHPNVMSLIGICFDGSNKMPMLVLPLMSHGDLHSYIVDANQVSGRCEAYLYE